jgi:DNA-binding transcriptional LysR family regulator
MHGRVSVNNSDAYQTACLAGLGLIQAPAVGVRALVEQGLLVEVLSQFTGEPMPVSLLVANRRHLAKRVRALMDWLAQTLEPYVERASEPRAATTPRPAPRSESGR